MRIFLFVGFSLILKNILIFQMYLTILYKCLNKRVDDFFPLSFYGVLV